MTRARKSRGGTASGRSTCSSRSACGDCEPSAGRASRCCWRPVLPSPSPASSSPSAASRFDDAADALADADLRWLIPVDARVRARRGAARRCAGGRCSTRDERPPLRRGHARAARGLLLQQHPAGPRRRGGQGHRAAQDARSTPRAETIGTVVVERVFDILALLIVLFASYPWLPGRSRGCARPRSSARSSLSRCCRRAGRPVIVRYDERAVHWLLSPLRRVKRARVRRARRAGRRSTRRAASSRCATGGSLIRRDPADGRCHGWMLAFLLLDLDGGVLISTCRSSAGVLVTVAINLSSRAAVRHRRRLGCSRRPRSSRCGPSTSPKPKRSRSTRSSCTCSTSSRSSVDRRRAARPRVRCAATAERPGTETRVRHDQPMTRRGTQPAGPAADEHRRRDRRAARDGRDLRFPRSPSSSPTRPPARTPISGRRRRGRPRDRADRRPPRGAANRRCTRYRAWSASPSPRSSRARSGRAENFFLPGLLANAAYASAFLISIAVRRPLVGLIVANLDGEGSEWRNDPERVRGVRARVMAVGLPLRAAPSDPASALPHPQRRRARRREDRDGPSPVRHRAVADLADRAAPPRAGARAGVVRFPSIAWCAHRPRWRGRSRTASMKEVWFRKVAGDLGAHIAPKSTECVKE